MADTQWRTHRLELDDQTLREWDAVVLASRGRITGEPGGIVLDRSAFYPGGGGRRRITASCSGAACRPGSRACGRATTCTWFPRTGNPLPPPGTTVRGAVEDERRTALMRTHSGLHVLCGVVFRDFGALVTGGTWSP